MKWFVALAQVHYERNHHGYQWGDENPYQAWLIRARSNERAMDIATRRVERYVEARSESVDVWIYPLAIEAERASTEKAYRPGPTIPKVGFALQQVYEPTEETTMR